MRATSHDSVQLCACVVVYGSTVLRQIEISLVQTQCAHVCVCGVYFSGCEGAAIKLRVQMGVLTGVHPR